MGIKTGAKDRLRIAGLFLYLTAKYGISAIIIIGIFDCTKECIALPLIVFFGWVILGIIEWVLYGKIVWKYEIKPKE